MATATAEYVKDDEEKIPISLLIEKSLLHKDIGMIYFQPRLFTVQPDLVMSSEVCLRKYVGVRLIRLIHHYIKILLSFHCQSSISSDIVPWSEVVHIHKSNKLHHSLQSHSINTFKWPKTTIEFLQ